MKSGTRLCAPRVLEMVADPVAQEAPRVFYSSVAHRSALALCDHVILNGAPDDEWPLEIPLSQDPRQSGVLHFFYLLAKILTGGVSPEFVPRICLYPVRRWASEWMTTAGVVGWLCDNGDVHSRPAVLERAFMSSTAKDAARAARAALCCKSN